MGHYTQMVWASTHEIGCGLSKCSLKLTGKTFYNYICNYCPMWVTFQAIELFSRLNSRGNRPGKLGRPYRKGKPCGMCPKNCYAKKLCTNSCHVADLWSNCRQLYKTWPDWLCKTRTPQGEERRKHCKATCTCKNKIFDWIKNWIVVVGFFERESVKTLLCTLG